MKIKVTTARPSFRRAGFTFTREPQILDTKKLKKGQLEAIQNEPHLNVQVAKEDKPAGGNGGNGGQGGNDGKKDGDNK